MPKVNTLFNYFKSPNPVKPANDKVTNNKQSNSPKPSTTKAERKTKETPKSKGKENRHVKERKRSLQDDDDEDNDELHVPKTVKKRRLIIPEDNSDDSGDDYKPASADESSEDDSEGVSESEPPTGTETEEDSPVKIKKASKPKAKRPVKPSAQKKKQTKETGLATEVQTQSFGNAPGSKDSWPHLKYDFIQPHKIRDINRRSPSDPDYDPRTLFVPTDFLNNQTPAMRQWWELKSKHYDCVLFFKVGKFYELYHMDAVIGVNELSLTFMRGEFAHSGFPEVGYGRYSASLIERGYKVARIEQTENPEMMSRRCSQMHKPTKFDKVVKREICQISTRGTRVYTSLDVEPSSHNSNYLLALIENCTPGTNYSSYGVCFIDTTIGDFYLGQYTDDRSNSRLLTMLAHYPPAHIVYERGNLSQRTMQILNNCLATAIKEPLQREVQFWSAETTLKNLHEGDYFKKESDFAWPEGLQPYLNEGDTLGLTPASDKQLAVHALGGCIYLLKYYLLDQQLLAQSRFKQYIPPDFSKNRTQTKFSSNMVLDASTIHNLRIFGEGSLFKHLDYCCTAFGKRLLREWLCRPSCSKDVIIERQRAIQELMERTDVVQSARVTLGTLPDLERLLSKIHAQGNAARMWNHPDGRAIMFEGQTYSKRKIMDFTNALEGFEKVVKLIALFNDFNDPLINRYTKIMPEGEFPSLQETLDYFKTAFDHEEAKKKGCIVPKAGVDDEYDSVLIELSDIQKDLDAYLEKQRKHFGTKVTFHGTDRKRYQIEIPESQEKKVGSGYELQSQRKGFKRYYTAEAKQLLARQINAEEHRDKVLRDLNRRIFAQFSEKFDMWSMAVHKIATLDVLISLAQYANTGDMCVPEINDNTTDDKIFIEIKDGKHPCIMSDNFIPNDTAIACEGNASLVILTGPNMGGKSTLMRQAGLLAVMSQIGSHVPASSCRLTLVDRIFTRLGAHDDILAGQSTFLVELTETATILQHATPYSLVLLDELGRGTSTHDGTAIAASVVDALTKLKCRTLFSTHYHALIEDYKSNTNVTLTHMACMVETEEEGTSQETVTFLYKLSEGACPKSYGFNAARLAGVPASITNRAHEIANRLEKETNDKHDFISLCKASESTIRDILFKI